jgi:hypothetical protein
MIDRYLALLGPPPTPPTPAPVSRLQQIALALQGFGARVQGQGPQFIAQQKALAERPQREYEQKQQQYDQQRMQLGVRGLEAAQTEADKRTAAQQAQADRQFEVEVQQRAKQMGFQDQVAIEKLRDAMQTQRDLERERASDEKQQALFKQQLDIEKGKLRKGFLDQGAGKHADELASYALGQIETLSPGAEKANTLIQAKIARLQGLAAKGSGGGGGQSAGKVMTWAELSDGSLVPSDKVKLDVLPPGVTVKRLFATGIPGAGGQPAQPSDNDIVTEIQARRGRGDSEASIRSFLRAQKIDEKKIEFLMSPPQGPPAPRNLPTTAPQSYPGTPAGPGFLSGRGQ